MEQQHRCDWRARSTERYVFTTASRASDSVPFLISTSFDNFCAGGYAAGGAFYAHLFGGVATNGTPGCPDPSPTNANWLYEVSTSEFSPQEAGPVAVTGLQSFPFGVPIYSVGGYAENCTTVGNTTVVQNVYMTDIFVFTPVVTLPPSPSPPPSTTTTTGTSGALASFRRLGASALVVLAWSALM